MNKLLFKGEKLVKRFEGKGGWTYVVFDVLKGIRKEALGMIKVKDSIDDCKIQSTHLGQSISNNDEVGQQDITVAELIHQKIATFLLYVIEVQQNFDFTTAKYHANLNNFYDINFDLILDQIPTKINQ
jgi:hypothetical protein